jgi:hypothetical protein
MQDTYSRVGQVSAFQVVGENSIQACFRGHAVEAGWFFCICEIFPRSSEKKNTIVRIRVMNQGAAVWVDYRIGSSLLDANEAVQVYEGRIEELLDRCTSAEWQWAVFKQDHSEAGMLNLLITMEFEGASVPAASSLALDAWYPKVIVP